VGGPAGTTQDNLRRRSLGTPAVDLGSPRHPRRAMRRMSVRSLCLRSRITLAQDRRAIKVSSDSAGRVVRRHSGPIPARIRTHRSGGARRGGRHHPRCGARRRGVPHHHGRLPTAGDCAIATVVSAHSSAAFRSESVAFRFAGTVRTVRLYGLDDPTVGQEVGVCTLDSWATAFTGSGDSSEWLRSQDPPDYPVRLGVFAMILGAGFHIQRRKTRTVRPPRD
jgi:hypothetical protein